MSELEELIEQRKEIDRKIRELKHTAKIFGRVKLELQRFPRGEEWTVFIRKKAQHLSEDRNVSVIQLNDKAEVLQELNNLIDDLTELKEKVRWTV